MVPGLSPGSPNKPVLEYMGLEKQCCSYCMLLCVKASYLLWCCGRVWGSAVAGSHFGLSGRCLNLFQLWLRGCPNCISELHIAHRYDTLCIRGCWLYRFQQEGFARLRLDASKGGTKVGRMKDPLYKDSYLGTNPPAFILPFEAPDQMEATNQVPRCKAFCLPGHDSCVPKLQKAIREPKARPKKSYHKTRNPKPLKPENLKHRNPV